MENETGKKSISYFLEKSFRFMEILRSSKPLGTHCPKIAALALSFFIAAPIYCNKKSFRFAALALSFFIAAPIYCNKKYAIRLKKSLGQNFLVDKNIIRKEAEIAQIKPHETILEVGPGAGFLTRELLLRAKKVIAIELDKNLAEILKKEFSKEFTEKKLEIISGDALEIDFPEFDKCVSNIPYEISSKIILKLGKYRKPAILIIQKEFAERLIALPGEGDYSKISAMSQYYFRAEILHIVSRKSFFPSPKIDSAIVRLTPQSEDFRKSLGIKDEELFLKTIHALFQHKNMAVRNAVIHSRGEFGFDKETAKRIADGITLKSAKVRTLNLAMIAEIAGEIHNRSN